VRLPGSAAAKGLAAAALAVGLASLGGCNKGKATGEPVVSEPASPPSVTAGTSTPAGLADTASPTATAPASSTGAEIPGDPERGRQLVVQFECSRCHEGTGVPAATQIKHCVRCHQDILAGHFAAPAAMMTRWQDHLADLREVPSLAALGQRYRRDWIAQFLLAPHDLRPRLTATMPRLALDPAQARDLAAYLTRDRTEPPPVSLDGASAAKGRDLYDAKGCASCHDFGGSGVAGVGPLAAGDRETRSAVSLAPDLRVTRDRFRPAELVRWLLDPKAVKADTAMPLVPLTQDEARDLAAFLLTAPLAEPPAREIPARLPILSRRVSYGEVYDRVLRSTCRHCHSEPDFALGEGGPGNTGGFGFPPRGLNLGSYQGVAAGMLDDHGERTSVFAPMADGTPRLVAVLLARQAEEAGRSDPALRGMPMALPALSPEEIQLVETWIAEGRPQ
jgi:cytochrome c2